MELEQSKEGLVTTLTVKVSQEDYAAKVEKELKKVRQTCQIKGFRPGNAPVSLIKRLYGQSVLLDEVNKLLVEAVTNYEKENAEHLVTHVIPAENGHLADIESQTDFEFTYLACSFPELTVQLSETELQYYNIIVSDEEIEHEIERLRNVFAKSEDADVAEDGCLLKVDIGITKDGEERTLSKNLQVSGISGECRPAFIGTKVNDKINVEIRKLFDDENSLFEMLEIDKEELGLLPETLPFAILEISKSILPEINQDFFDTVAEDDAVHSEEELREYIRKNIAEEYEKASLIRLYEDSVDILKSKADITLPEDYIRKYLSFVQEDEEEDMSGEDFESVVKIFIEEATWSHIVNALLLQAGIEITAENIQDDAREIIMDYYGKVSVEYADTLLKYHMKSKEGTKFIFDKVTKRKFSTMLKNSAKLNITDISFDDFRKLYETKTEQEPENQEQIEDNKEEKEV